MNVRRPTGRANQAIRDRVFTRDDHRCIDCGPRARSLPDSMLEADHDIELTDGGTNDLSNLVTRCIPHHEAKTQERRMARTTGNTTRNPRAVTAQLPDRPSLAAHARAGIGCALLVGGAQVAAHVLGYDHSGLATGVAVAALVVAGLIWYARWLHWRRLCEAQRVFERLATLTDLPYAARRPRFKVTSWSGVEPRAVTLAYGNGFAAADPASWDKLREVYAHALGVDPGQVQVRRRPRGRAHLALTGAHELHDPSPCVPATVTPPPPPSGGTATARIQEALAAVLEGCTVQVTAWNPDASPAALTIAYPPYATKAAREARPDLPTLMADVSAPRSADGHWRVEWEPSRDLFRATDEPDALAPIVPLPPIESDLDLAEGPILGRDEDGDAWRQPLLHNHVLIAGATGSGKGSVLWGIIRGVHALIREGRVRLWVIDPKGGMELGVLEPIAHRFSLANDAERVLAEAAEVMGEQAGRLRAGGLRKLEHPTVDMPLHLVVVDELAAITSLAPDSRVRAAINAHMGRLLTQGRAVGFSVVSALQDPSKETLKNRNLFPGRIGLRLDERTQADMVLGAGARASGAVCDAIPRSLPGVGYVALDGRAGYRRVRAAFVSDDELTRLTSRPPEQHRPVTMGEQLALEPAHRDPAVRLSSLADGAHVRLPDDPDPVRIISIEPDPDEPEDRIEVTYRYDGEAGDRVCSFDRDTMAETVADS